MIIHTPADQKPPKLETALRLAQDQCRPVLILDFENSKAMDEIYARMLQS